MLGVRRLLLSTCAGLFAFLPLTALARSIDTTHAATLLASPSGEVPTAIEDFRLVRSQVDQSIRFVFCPRLAAECSGVDQIEFVLSPRSEGRHGTAETPSFNVTFKGPMVDGAPTPAVLLLYTAVLDAVRRNDPGNLEPVASIERRGTGPVHDGKGGPGLNLPFLILEFLFLAALAWAAWGTIADLRSPPAPAPGRPAAAGPAPVRHALAGDVVFLVSLAGFIVLCLSRIPCDYLDLWYLFDLEEGRPNQLELVHPVYLPVLVAFQALLRLFGFGGRMLVPVEALNVGVAATANWLVYRLARRFSADALAAAAATAVAMVGAGIGLAAIRPTPYAWGYLFVVLASWICLSPQGLVSRRRVALAGLATGVAMGFHLSAMALIPVVLVCLVAESPRNLRPVGLLGARYLRAVTATLLVEYGLLAMLRDLGVQRLVVGDGDGYGVMYRKFEQFPGTSLLTSGSVLTQVSMYCGNLHYFDAGLIALLALVLVLGVARYRQAALRRIRADRMPWIVATAVFAGFAGFFLFNNARNGFVFASLILLPVILAIGMTWTPRMVWVIAPIAACVAVAGAIDLQSTGTSADKDPMYLETLFLDDTLREQDVLVVPGCPCPELLYLKHLNVLGVTDRPAESGGRSCETPMVLPDSSFLDRLAWYRARGSRVLYTNGDVETDFGGDASGAEKSAQVFHSHSYMAQDRKNLAGKVNAILRQRFTLNPGPMSPQARPYFELEIRDDAEPPQAPTTPPDPAGPARELPERLAAIGRLSNLLDIALLTAYLERWAAAVPGDPYLECDLVQAVCALEPGGGGDRCAPNPRCTHRAVLVDEASSRH